jgi:PAS domain S-box-containing protein
MLRSFKSSLWARSAVFLCSGLICILALTTAANMFFQHVVFTQREQVNAKKISDLVLLAIRYPMLNGDQEVIQKQFETYRTFKDIDVLNLMDDKGIIRRSTVAKQIGLPFASIHIKQVLNGKEYHGLEYRHVNRKKVYSELIPIRNEEKCYPCHESKERTLGVLSLEMDWKPVEQLLVSNRNRNVLLSLLGLGVMILLSVFLILRIVIKPIKKLEAGVIKVSEGDLNIAIAIDSQDEIGNLTRLFNQMAQELRKLVEQEQNKTEELVELNVSLQAEIAERRKVEIALQDSNRSLSEIINFLPEAIMVIDVKGKVVAWNKAIEDLTGVESEDILGKGDYAYAIPFYGQPRPVLIDAALHPELFFEARYNVLSKEGNTFIAEAFVPAINKGKGGYVWAKATPLYDAQGNIIAAIESISDITERKLAEAKLEKAYNELKNVQSQLIQSAKMASIGTLAGGVAHEINNPLTGVINNVQLIKMLAKEKVTFNMAEFKELLDAIEDSAHRCIKITRSLLDFSHASKGQFSSLNFNEVVEKVLVFVEHEMNLGNIKIGKQLQPDLFPVIGDHQLLQQVILDLLSNARWAINKKSDKDGGEIIIKTENDPARKGINIYVSDTGIGITEADQQKIFEPFFTTKEVGEGTGLGLAIIYNIVKIHKGQIEVQSVFGQGTLFKIFLPAD